MNSRGFRSLDSFGIQPTPEPNPEGWHLPYPLRDYQQDAVTKLLAKGHGTIKLPTGSGKTLVATAIILAVHEPAVVLVPTKVLIDQVWVPELRKAGIEPGVWYGEEKRPSFVTVSTYQSLYSNPELIRGFDVVLFDEGDLAVGEVWSRILDEAKRHRYAAVLTATLPTDPERRRMLLASFPLVAEATPKEQIARGVFVPVDVQTREVSLLGPETKAYEEIEKRMRNLRFVLRTGRPQEVVKLTGSGNPDVRKAAFAYLKLLSARSDLLARTPARASALLAIAQAHPGQRVLVFGTRVESLADSLAYLTMSGVPSRVISAETRAADRRAIFDEWGRSVQVVGSVDVLTRGVNVPEAAIAVILGGGTGERRLIQRVGRVVRQLPGKTIATVYLIVARGTTEERLIPITKRIFASPEATVEEGDEDAE